MHFPLESKLTLIGCTGLSRQENPLKMAVLLGLRGSRTSGSGTLKVDRVVAGNNLMLVLAIDHAGRSQKCAIWSKPNNMTA